ncbi:unnamed protein product [Lepeophtheirus salmonis]|uniref:(salmon louse) hypothetical protein n=2 Tax=Lepeophtheirus salmonis TaxID=72036 RepID=A0A7R8D3W5_LEPSM|nr:unnamed protein product [Lepeophtheirus salmonis]CAF3018300.1 unnamed protein product [Lepeophtheirus salmonis]
MKCSILLFVVVASAVADHPPPAPYQPAPYHPAPAPYRPSPAPYHPAPYKEEEPKNYAYSYDVNEYDEYGNPNIHSKTETRDGYKVEGQYKVQLPDCRTQIVDYYVDEYKQFHADVKYEGQICDDYSVKAHKKPAPYQPAPYKSAPAPYKPAPAPYQPAPYKPAPAPYRPAPYNA